MGRAPCCDKANVKKGPWSPEEDAKLKAFIEQHGTGGNWIALPQKIGLKRCGKSCRLRWLNYLRPNIKHGGFSKEEDNIICSLYISIGSRWSIIAAQLPGRTDNDIKNYWNTRLKKQFIDKRKERQAQRLSNLKHEVVLGGNKSVTAAKNGHQNPYVPHHNPDPTPNDHASIRNLLIRLGGQFAANNLHNPLDISTDHHLYSTFSTNNDGMQELLVQSENLNNGFSTPITANGFSDSCNSPGSYHVLSIGNQYNLDQTGMNLLQGSSVFPVEPVDVNNYNSQGLDSWECLYGADMIDGSHINASESTNWEEVNSSSSFTLLYPNFASQNESYQQGVLHECMVETRSPYVAVRRDSETLYTDGVLKAA